ncbi:MAG: hypothetical protein JWL70_1518 [Acidimicrobiia bacterium]|nr:hypothetical protein [Acidimicrobiia bacterium]
MVNRIDWRAVARWAMAGVALQVLLVVGGVLHNGPLVDIVAPGRTGPAAAVIHHDFPDYRFVRDTGHDGQQYYAIARQPMHPHAAAAGLDRPRYRMERILLPGLAWMLHPSPGYGLVVALVAVGVAGLIALAVSAGAWASHLGASPKLGFVAALLPGSNAALQITTPDTLALGLALGAILATHRRCPALAVALGAGAILAKESAAGIVVVGFLTVAAHHRWRMCAMAVIPAAAWWIALRFIFPGPGAQVIEFGLPLDGLRQSVDRLWGHGLELWGMACVVAVLLAGPWALWRHGRRRNAGTSHPLWWPLAVQMAMVLCLGINSVGPAFNASRILQPAFLLAILMLVTPRQVPDQELVTGVETLICSTV